MEPPKGQTPEATGSCLYVGQVMHHRLTPRAHRFSYTVPSLLLDLDDLPALQSSPTSRNLSCGGTLLRLLSHNRPNLFSVHDADLGDGGDPRAWIRRVLADHGVDSDGPVRVHLFPRVAGFGFTPLTTWFCHHRDGTPSAVVYEVHNTFGERHSYLVPLSETRNRTLTHSADKCFHVSPFLGLEASYHFGLRLPGERYVQTIRETDRQTGETVLVASHIGKRIPLTDAALVRMALLYPLLPLRILGGIHYEALRLWLKGAPFFRKPAPPVQPVSVWPPPPPA